MSYAIDPHQSWLPLRRWAAEHEGRPAALVSEVADHMEAEIKGELEPLMNTLTADPVYHFWGRGEPMVLSGRESVSQFYAGMFATGGQQFEVVVERIVAGEDHVVTEGQVKQVQQGAALLAMGLEAVDGVPVTEESLWLSDAQLVTVWPADADGKLIGEDIYFGVDPMSTLRPITADQLPPYYVL